MEFHEKLQVLRKQKGLTQEELAQQLYVSRTAVSKWESGRGFPNIDSLKAISQYFSVTVDHLLSSEALLVIAEDDRKHQASQTRDLVFGLLDSSMLLLLFLPCFGQSTVEGLRAVSLLALHSTQPWLKIAYCVVVIGMILAGILTLALQTKALPLWTKYKVKLSFLLHLISTFLFIISRQPYAAALTFLFLIIKALMLKKTQ